MHRRALHFGAFLLVVAACSRVLAHVGPPVAFGVLSQDEQGPRAVSFNAGVALRRSAQRYQFVCPGAWQDQFSAPVAALADGTIVVGATHGLMLLDEAGTLRAHPDPAAVGRSSEVVRSTRGVFSLRPALQGSELLAIDAQSVRVLWKDTTAWSSLAASAEQLVLVRAANRLVEMVVVSAADGSELARSSASLELPVDYAYARADTSSAFALVVYRSGRMALGTLAMNAFTKLGEAELSIAGPLRIENATLLALDGKLEQVTEGALLPLADEHNVVCLGELDGLAYACEREGISRVSAQVVGDPLFRFNWLMPPALEQVPEGDPRMLCNMQWQDFLLDMQLAMLGPLVDPSTPTAMAGAGSPQLPAAGAAALGSSMQPVQAPASGCSTQPGRRGGAYLFGAMLALVVLRCRYSRRCKLI